LHALDCDQPGDDPGGAVEVAAIGDGVEMRSRHEARCKPIGAWQRHEKIGRVIAARLEPHGIGTLCDQPVSELLAWPVGVAG
jgi:hypothetical protein